MNNEIKNKNKNKPRPFSALCHKMIYVTTMSSVSSSTCFAFNFREPRLQGGKKQQQNIQQFSKSETPKAP